MQNENILKEDNFDKPALIDLFCGAGGLAAGFTTCGFSTRLASDIWTPAAKTYQQNFPDHSFVQSDIRDLDTALISSKLHDDSPLVVAGGPPCQGFSSAGARVSTDHRNTLVSVYARTAVSLNPEIIVFENVEGFLTLDGGKFVLDLILPLIEAGYRVRLEKLNVANFGVPQLRKRVIVIAARGRNPISPVLTTKARGMPGAELVGDGLPQVSGVEEYLLKHPPIHGDPLAIGRDMSEIETERIRLIPQGGTMRDLPEHLQHASWTGRANRRVRDGLPTEKRGGAPIGMRRLVGEEPSKAITSAATREFIHPTLDRTLTLREAATLQTFSTDYRFVGNRSEIATLIGNAIPPVFAAAVGTAVQRTLALPSDSTLNGEICALSLTNSSGMSPALKNTYKLLMEYFPNLNSVEEGRLF